MVLSKTRTVSVATFAEIIGKTPRRAQQLIQEGMPHRLRGANARIVPRQAVDWLVERAKSAAMESGARIDVAHRERELRLRLLEHDALERELAVVDVEAARAFARDLVNSFSRVATDVLQRFEREMLATVTPADARRVREAIYAALMRGALEAADQFAAVTDPPAGSGVAA